MKMTINSCFSIEINYIYIFTININYSEWLFAEIIMFFLFYSLVIFNTGIYSAYAYFIY